MSLYSDPPPLTSFQHDKPSLLVCWWVTIFCTVIIALRVGGRFIRSERLFAEDKVAALALIPLYLRMGCVHVILVNGTNNAQLGGANLTDDAVRRKRTASGLVLFSRILFAATLWILKNTTLEFFRRLNVSWDKSYVLTLKFIRGTLAVTFLAVVISDLVECQPFSHYWQVLPDPGGQCRQGYAQLLTMAACNVLTDLLLVVFPIPIILRSRLSVKRKVELVLLFSLGLVVVATTLYRVPQIIRDRGSQRSRSLYASVELLFATAAANTLVLGSFVRDRGVKKKKFKYGSVAAGSLDRPSATESRRPTLNKHWGSLEDLARDTGFGVQPELRAADRPIPRKRSYAAAPGPRGSVADDLSGWRFPRRPRGPADDDDNNKNNISNTRDAEDAMSPTSSYITSPRRVTFYDVGGLLDDQQPDDQPEERRHSGASESWPVLGRSPPQPTVPPLTGGFRRGSSALIQEIGGLLNPRASRPSPPLEGEGTELRAFGRSDSDPARSQLEHNRREEPVLRDPGGLLDV